MSLSVVFVIVVVVAAVLVFARTWRAETKIEEALKKSSQFSSRQAEEEWAKNFEAASERMDAEYPDPPET